MENIIIKENRQWIDDVWNKLDNKISRTAISSRYKIPYTTVNGVHDNRFEVAPDAWTNGFWGGLMWLMYVGTGNEEYKKTAEISEKMLDKAFEDFKSLNHDVGFMWHLTSGANYRITGNARSLNRSLFAAAVLASRYNVDGGYIRAWNGDGSVGWTIIDCMMNLPLLYWASEELGDDRFKRIAQSHADKAIKYHIRDDGSTNHIVEYNPETGDFVKTHAGQGYCAGSCWTRGLAWAIYGTVLSHIYTKKEEYLKAAIKMADYYINNISDDYLTVVDFKAPHEPIFYDSTAGVCIACGLIELSKCIEGEEGNRYLQTAINILKATDVTFCDYGDDSDAVVHSGTGAYPNVEWKMSEVHIPIIYGDFFFVEAMLKLKGHDFLIW